MIGSLTSRRGQVHHNNIPRTGQQYRAGATHDGPRFRIHDGPSALNFNSALFYDTAHEHADLCVRHHVICLFDAYPDSCNTSILFTKGLSS